MQTLPQQHLLKATGQEAVPPGASAPLKAAHKQKQTRRSRLYDTFFQSEDGAVTVDWVVLTAAIVGLGLVVMIPIGYGTETSVVALEGTITAVNTGYVSTAP